MKYLKIKNNNEVVPVGKIVCVGKNYEAHAKEMGGASPGYPLIFLKPASNIVLSGEPVIHPSYSNNLQHEVELVLYIGEDVKNANASSAEKAIHGYAVGLDMTLRDLQFQFKEKGEPWTLAKCFDSAAVLSDVILKSDYQLRGDENISLSVNGEIKQNTSLKNMIFSSAELVSYISSRMTLEKGDLIFTGTPEGVSRVILGDKIFAEIENIGNINTEIINSK